jgi:hypothetical protein
MATTQLQQNKGKPEKNSREPDPPPGRNFELNSFIFRVAARKSFVCRFLDFTLYFLDFTFLDEK